MFSLFNTLLFYNFLIISSFLLCSSYERKKNIRLLYGAYSIIILASVFRYDIGTDYSGTYLDVYDRLHTGGGLRWEGFISESIKSPGELFLTVLFSAFPNPAVWVINTYFIIFIYCLYKIFDYFQIHKWGLFCLFLSLIIFQAWDWSKQYASVAILTYSIIYIDQKKYKRFLICFLISITLHLSSFLFLPLFFLRKIKVSHKTLSYLLLFVFVLSQLGFFRKYYVALISYVPFYGQMYAASLSYGEMGESVVGTASYTFYCIWFIVLLFFSRKDLQTWNIMLFVGGFLYMVSENSLLIDRVAVYYSASQLVIFPLIMKGRHPNYRMLFLRILIFLNLFLINRRFVANNDLRGCVPYETIFSTEYERGILRESDHGN